MTTYFNDYPKELQAELQRIANAIVAPGKGILAADESTATCGKRFQVSFLLELCGVAILMRLSYFRTLDVRTPRRIVAHTASCSSPPRMLSPQTSRESSCSTRPSTRKPPMAELSSKSSRRRESFPESRLTAVLLTCWPRKVSTLGLLWHQNCEIDSKLFSPFIDF
jgi:Fructose-bisphosphate aldolase class-I